MDRVVRAEVGSSSRLGLRLADRYRLVRLIRQVDGADVYEAEDEKLERRVAVQISGRVVDREAAGVLDAGEHEGFAFVVWPLADASAPGAPMAVGDDSPTELLATVRGDTAVLPVPLVPTDDPSPEPEPHSRWSPAIGSLAGRLWRRRAVLVAVAGVVVLVLLVALSSGGSDLDVPPATTVPVTATPTTEAPTTTSPPTTEPAPKESRGKGKGRDKGEG